MLEKLAKFMSFQATCFGDRGLGDSAQSASVINSLLHFLELGQEHLLSTGFLPSCRGTMPHKVRTAPGVIATSMPHIHVVQAINSAGHLLGHRLELGEPGICSEGFTNLNSRTQALESTASVETGRQSQKAFGCSSRSSAQLSCKLQAALGRQAGERLLVIPLQM